MLEKCWKNKICKAKKEKHQIFKKPDVFVFSKSKRQDLSAFKLT